METSQLSVQSTAFPLTIKDLKNIDRRPGGGNDIDVVFAVGDLPPGFKVVEIDAKVKFVLDQGGIREGSKEFKSNELISILNKGVLTVGAAGFILDGGVDQATVTLEATAQGQARATRTESFNS